MCFLHPKTSFILDVQVETNEKEEKEQSKEEEKTKNNGENKEDNNYVFLLGKSNKKLDEGNLPSVFKELVHDAKALTDKIKNKHKNDKEDDSDNEQNSGKEIKNAVNLKQFGQLKDSEDNQNKMHSPVTGLSFSATDKMNNNEKGQNTEDKPKKPQKQSEQSRVINMLKKYVQKQSKQLYPTKNADPPSDVASDNMQQRHHKQQSHAATSNDGYDLGDLGDTMKNYMKNTAAGAAPANSKDKDVERVAQSIINKFTTKAGVLDLPNDVVMEADGKAGGNIMNNAAIDGGDGVGKSQKKQEGCCAPVVDGAFSPPSNLQAPAPPPPPPPPENEPKAATKPASTNKAGSKEQEKLHKLLERKQKLDQLQSEYEHELASFKSELQQDDPKKASSKKETTKEDDNAEELMLPKEMNGCGGSKTTEQMEKCLQSKKGETDEEGQSSNDTPPSNKNEEKSKNDQSPREDNADRPTDKTNELKQQSPLTEADIEKELSPDKTINPSPKDPDREGKIDEAIKQTEPVPFDTEKQEKEAAKVAKDFKQNPGQDKLKEDLQADAAKNKGNTDENDKPIESSPDKAREEGATQELKNKEEKVQEDKLSKEEDDRIQANLFGKIKEARGQEGEKTRESPKDDSGGNFNEESKTKSDNKEKSEDEIKEKSSTEKDENKEKSTNESKQKDEKKETSLTEEDNKDKEESLKTTTKEEDCNKSPSSNNNKCAGELTITSDEDLLKPQNEQDKEKIVKQITKLQKALASYYKSTKSQLSMSSTPIVLVHEISVVNKDKDKENNVAKQLNKQITNLQSMLKEQQKIECQPVLTKIKGKLILNKDCSDKKKKKRSNFVHTSTTSRNSKVIMKSNISKLQKISKKY